MKQLALLSTLLLLVSGLLPAQLTVWPGDANNNGVANHYDLLYIGLGFGQMGPARTVQGNAWQGNAASTWQQGTPGGSDYAYGDSDGDGFIDAADTAAIGQNFLLTHGPLFADSLSPTAPNAPTLLLDFQLDTLVYTNDTTFMVNILLGDSTSIIDSLYGLAFTILFDTSLVDSVIYNLQGGFLGAGSSLLTMGKVRGGRADLALSRTDQVSAVGFGAIGSIGIVMDDNLRTTQDFSLGLRVVDIKAIGRNESLIPINPSGDTLTVRSLTTQRTQPQPGLAIYPVPAHDWLEIRGQTPLDDIQLFDLHGREVLHEPAGGELRSRLAVHDLPEGIYLLQIRSEGVAFRQRILIQTE